MDSFCNCFCNSRVSRHAKIVIGTPDSDIFLPPGELACCREAPGISVHLLEDPVGVIQLLLLDLALKERFISKGRFVELLNLNIIREVSDWLDWGVLFRFCLKIVPYHWTLGLWCLL